MIQLTDLWIVTAGLTPKHEPKFQSVFDNEKDALIFADQLSNALYPDTVLEKQVITSLGIKYLHPDSVAGEWAFIEVFPFSDSIPADSLEFFKSIAHNRKHFWGVHKQSADNPSKG